MTNDNIFAAPQAEVQDLAGGHGLYSDTAVMALRRTRPWALVMAILGMISAVFMLLATIAIGIEGNNLFRNGSMWLMVGTYVLLTLTTFIASIQLFQFASAIKRALETMQSADLDKVLLAQANFWRLIGILSLGLIILSIVGTIGMLLIFSRTF